MGKKKHGIDLAAANKNGDSLFLIQGRNENKGEFWNDDKTLLLGKKTHPTCPIKPPKPKQNSNKEKPSPKY